MANMSYCRFRNTFNDLNDCVGTLYDIVWEECKDDISREEKWAAKQMYDLCKEFISLYEKMEEIEEEIED